eukprot:7385549-Prymnesium_polylepis.4
MKGVKVLCTECARVHAPCARPLGITTRCGCMDAAASAGGAAGAVCRKTHCMVCLVCAVCASRRTVWAVWSWPLPLGHVVIVVGVLAWRHARRAWRGNRIFFFSRSPSVGCVAWRVCGGACLVYAW